MIIRNPLDLPKDLLNMVFEYDPTYKRGVFKNVLREMEEKKLYEKLKEEFMEKHMVGCDHCGEHTTDENFYVLNVMEGEIMVSQTEGCFDCLERYIDFMDEDQEEEREEGEDINNFHYEMWN